jgi:hypothetical protein
MLPFLPRNDPGFLPLRVSRFAPASQEGIPSDLGALLLAAVDRRISLIDRLIIPPCLLSHALLRNPRLQQN